MYYVYIVECADKTFYTGTTNDVEKRVRSHNESKSGAKYTKARRPVTLRYTEECKNKSEALKREWALKRLSRQEKIKLLKESLKK